MNVINIILIIILILILIYLYVSKRKLHSSDVIFTEMLNNPKKLMIVAHPDDEIIFGGNLLLDGNWKVVCVTNATDKSQNKFTTNKISRKDEFVTLMRHLKCSYEIWDNEDNLFNANWNIDNLLKNLNRVINEKNYQMIVTHNLQGEYGHIQHKKISRIIHDLKPSNLYVFHTDSNLTNNNYDSICDLAIKFYSTQSKVINKHNKDIMYQTIKSVNLFKE